MVSAVATVVEHGEAVEENTLHIGALPGLHYAALAHGDEMRPHGDAVSRAGLVVVALLIVMDSEFIHGDALRYQVVGDKLVEHVVLVGIVTVVLCLGVEILVDDPFLHVIHGDVLHWLAQRLAPELVGLGEESESELPMRRARIGCPVHWRVFATGDDIGLHQHFIVLVLYLRQGVYQSASFHKLGHDVVAALGVAGIVVQGTAQRLIARCDDIAHLVYISVDGFDVPVLERHGADAVDEA